MISCDEVSAVTRRKARQRLRMAGKLLDTSVHQIAGNGDHVGVELVHGVDDRVEIAALDRRPDVNVADLRDREPVQ